MLLMEHPCRLSTDIDIIAEPGTDLDKYLDRIAAVRPVRNYNKSRLGILI